ncbi:MAG: hypothetical protein IKQ72_04145, partial [Bacteroidaceae bacterium]|nr:hypothetical protein [Bacteroidaceae bacterium]
QREVNRIKTRKNMFSFVFTMFFLLAALRQKKHTISTVQVEYRHAHQLMFVLFVQNGKSGLS